MWRVFPPLFINENKEDNEMLSTSIFFHNGYKFNLSPMVIKSVNSTDSSISMMIEFTSDAGSNVMPCSCKVDGNTMIIKTLDGNSIKVMGERTQYEGGM